MLNVDNIGSEISQMPGRHWHGRYLRYIHHLDTFKSHSHFLPPLTFIYHVQKIPVLTVKLNHSAWYLSLIPGYVSLYAN